jgi:hypothetical protein
MSTLVSFALLRIHVHGIDSAVGVGSTRSCHALPVAGELAVAGVAPNTTLKAVPVLDSLPADAIDVVEIAIARTVRNILRCMVRTPLLQS